MAAVKRASSRRPAGSGPKGLSWRQAKPAPVVVVSGPESFLADRAVDRIVSAARRREPELELSTVDAADYQAGTLSTVTSPSLFAEPRVVVVRNLAEAAEAAQTEVGEYLAAVDESVVLVLVHSGAPRAKKLVDGAVNDGAVLVSVTSMRRDDERLAFVASEFTDAGRRITAPAAQALVDAFGSDLRELAGSCAQLMADVEGDVDETAVRRYYGGRAEATGFEVADAVVARDRTAALLAVRRALHSGESPIPLVAALAARLRSMAKVAAVSGPSAQVASELGMAPWLVDRTRRELRGWNAQDLGRGLVALAEVDLALKGGLEVGGRVTGGSFDNVYTLESAILSLTR